MASQPCSLIRSALVDYFGDQTEVLDLRDTCIISLPIKTLDNRWVDVYVDQRDGFYIVHDAGKTHGELISHGVKMTPARSSLLSEIAGRFGAGVDNGTFVLGCKSDGLYEAIFSVAQCASLGMLEALKHEPVVEEEPVISLVGDVMGDWSLGKGKCKRRLTIKGASSPHQLDFVFYPIDAYAKHTIAVNILTPSYTAMTSARNYGFLALDVENSQYRLWSRLAVLARKSQWSPDAIALVEKHAAKTIALRAGANTSDIDGPLTEALNDLLAA